jgi:hypothetical protein
MIKEGGIMKRQFLMILITLLGFLSMNATEPDKEILKCNQVYDICNIFLTEKPIINYDELFGTNINANNFFIADNNHNCMEFEYKFNKKNRLIEKKIFHIYTAVNELRKYEYDDKGLLSEVRHYRNDYQKRLKFNYDIKGKLVEMHEIIESDEKDELFKSYDYLSYKFNQFGNIFEVRGIISSMLGLKKKSEILKIYDYDSYNRLKSIRNFKNPDENRILRYDEFVKCSQL